MNTYMPAEWHLHERCWMAWPCFDELWPNGIKEARLAFAAVANAISLFEPVVMVVRKQDAASARAFLGPKTQLLECDLDDSWMRDFGPTFVLRRDGGKAGINWIFNGWGKYPYENDQLVAKKMLKHLGLECIDIDIVNEGGAIHVDGEGTILLTETVQLNANRNPGTSKAEFEKILSDTLGTTKAIWLPQGLKDDDTDGHIDELACFIRPGVVLALDTDDKQDDNYDVLKTNLEILRSSTDAKGRPLDVRTILQPEAEMVDGRRLSKSYINFYIANGGIVMPAYSHEKDDRAAYETMQQCFPDRKILQIDARDIVCGGGNIHCITQQEPSVLGN